MILRDRQPFKILICDFCCSITPGYRWQQWAQCWKAALPKFWVKMHSLGYLQITVQSFVQYNGFSHLNKSYIWCFWGTLRVTLHRYTLSLWQPSKVRPNFKKNLGALHLQSQWLQAVNDSGLALCLGSFFFLTKIAAVINSTSQLQIRWDVREICQRSAPCRPLCSQMKFENMQWEHFLEWK